MDDKIKPNPKAEALAMAKAEQEAKSAALNKLKESVGKKFTDGELVVSVTGFEPQKGLGPVWKPAYLVNFGNPNASHYIHCEDFNQQFNSEVKG